MDNFKKSGRNEEQIKKNTLIIMKILRTQIASLGTNYWLLKSVL